MERLFVKYSLSGNVSIYFRPLHAYLEGHDKLDVKKRLKELLAMSTKEFYEYLDTKRVAKFFRPAMTSSGLPFYQDKEDWYEGAWKMQTERLFKEFKLVNVEEDYPFELLRESEVKRRENTDTSWNISTKDREKSIAKKTIVLEDVEDSLDDLDSFLDELDFDIDLPEIEDSEDVEEIVPKKTKKVVKKKVVLKKRT